MTQHLWSPAVVLDPSCDVVLPVFEQVVSGKGDHNIKAEIISAFVWRTAGAGWRCRSSRMSLSRAVIWPWRLPHLRCFFLALDVQSLALGCGCFFPSPAGDADGLVALSCGLAWLVFGVPGGVPVVVAPWANAAQGSCCLRMLIIIIIEFFGSISILRPCLPTTRESVTTSST